MKPSDLITIKSFIALVFFYFTFSGSYYIAAMLGDEVEVGVDTSEWLSEFLHCPAIVT